MSKTVLVSLGFALTALSTTACIAVESQDDAPLQEVSVEAPAVELLLSMPTAPVVADHTGTVQANGVDLYYAMKGEGPYLILLHGGLGNLNQWALQMAPLSQDFTVIAFDSRGHGRSTRDDRALGINLMAEDIVAAMAALDIDSASIAGWSDGGNIALDIALNHPEKVQKIVTLGANFSVEGAAPDAGTKPLIGEYVGAMAAQYDGLSNTAEDFAIFSGEVFAMWGTEPSFSLDQLSSISAPALIMHGEFEEAILMDHSVTLANTLENGEFYLMEDVSHFGLWQNPEEFNAVASSFLTTER